MTPFDDKIEAVQKFNKNDESIVIDLTKGFEAEIVDFITDDQLFKGLDGEGQRITPGYRPLTVRIKREKGQPTDRVTLKDTGDFYESILLDFRERDFAVVATDDKVRKIERKYGKNVLGLSEKGLEELREIIRPVLIEYLRKKLG